MKLTFSIDFKDKKNYASSGKGIEKMLLEAIGSLKPEMNLDIHHKKTMKKGKVKDTWYIIPDKKWGFVLNEDAKKIRGMVKRTELIAYYQEKENPGFLMDEKEVSILSDDELFDLVFSADVSVLVDEVYSVGVKAGVLDIEISCSLGAKASRSKKSSSLVVKMDSIPDFPGWESILENASIYLESVQRFLFQAVEKGKSPWIPYEAYSDEYYATVTFMYINSRSLRQVLLVDNISMLHIYKYLEWENEFNKNDDFFNDNMIGNIIEDSNYKVPSPKSIAKLSDCLGLFMRITSDSKLTHMRTIFPDMQNKFGNYIFLCPFNIDDFMKELRADYSLLPAEIKELISWNQIEGVNTEKELLLKLVFLHEVGHMVMHSESTKKKRTEKETLANWVSTFTLSIFEKEYVQMKTEIQPKVYQDFITLPQYAIAPFRIGTVNDYGTYNITMKNLLDKHIK